MLSILFSLVVSAPQCSDFSDRLTVSAQMSKAKFEELADFIQKEDAEPFESLKLGTLTVIHKGHEVALEVQDQIGSVSFSNSQTLSRQKAFQLADSMKDPVFPAPDWRVLDGKMAFGCKGSNSQPKIECSFSISNRDYLSVCSSGAGEVSK